MGFNDHMYGHARVYRMIVPYVGGFVLSNTLTPCNQIEDPRLRDIQKPQNLASEIDLEGELIEGIHFRCCLGLGGLGIDLHHTSSPTPSPSSSIVRTG
jgi:hypothetical protein